MKKVEKLKIIIRGWLIAIIDLVKNMPFEQAYKLKYGIPPILDISDLTKEQLSAFIKVLENAPRTNTGNIDSSQLTDEELIILSKAFRVIRIPPAKYTPGR